VAEILWLQACGWGLKRIARQLGCSHHTGWRITCRRLRHPPRRLGLRLL